MSIEQQKSIVREYVFDTLVENVDNHPEQMLMTTQDGFVATDKSQAFKYTDRKIALDPKANPNSEINGSSNVKYLPIYYDVISDILEGKSSLTKEDAWKEVSNVLKKVDAISESEYKQMLTPYAVYRFDVNRSKEEKINNSEEFLTYAVERKNTLSNDFAKLFKVEIDAAMLNSNVEQPKVDRANLTGSIKDNANLGGAIEIKSPVAAPPVKLLNGDKVFHQLPDDQQVKAGNFRLYMANDGKIKTKKFERWTENNTHLDEIDEKFKVKEFIKARVQQREQNKTNEQIMIGDWGAGKGTFLRELREWL